MQSDGRLGGVSLESSIPRGATLGDRQGLRLPLAGVSRSGRGLRLGSARAWGRIGSPSMRPAPHGALGGAPPGGGGQPRRAPRRLGAQQLRGFQQGLRVHRAGERLVAQDQLLVRGEERLHVGDAEVAEARVEEPVRGPQLAAALGLHQQGGALRLKLSGGTPGHEGREVVPEDKGGRRRCRRRLRLPSAPLEPGAIPLKGRQRLVALQALDRHAGLQHVGEEDVGVDREPVRADELHKLCCRLHVGVEVLGLADQPRGRPEPPDVLEVALEVRRVGPDDDVDEDGEEVVGPRGGASLRREEVGDDPAAVEDAHELVARGLVRVDLLELLLREDPLRVVPEVVGDVEVLGLDKLQRPQVEREDLVALTVFGRRAEASVIKLCHNILL
mmetsp:Transcript_20066/g.47791  ORF Transcript_20066/g.47791 Transcript_20066/m.47791 type:complete len:387 (-) Transcript_20066:993-2153(-)